MTKEIISTRKKVFFDIALNIVAAALPVAMLQLIIYPQVARDIGGDEYGLMLTIYSLWMMIPFPLGNVLNNIKLLRLPAYQEIGQEGDIAILLRQWSTISSIVVFVLIWFYCGSFSVIHTVLGAIIGFGILLKSYLEVGFRINLNYVNILINNVLLSFGYITGFFLFKIWGIWELIFLVGQLFSCCYCMIKTRLLEEIPQRTTLFSSVRRDSYSLLVAGVIDSSMNFADKLVLFPLMGGFEVSIYYTATILGKIIGMLTGPMNSVILSYISRWDKSKADVFSKVLIIGIVISVMGYISVFFLAKPIIGFLFPQWLEKVVEIMPLTTVAIMLTVLASFLQPFVLKYCKMQWQIGVSGVGSAVYFLCALILWNYMGLKGFCIGTIIGVLVKLVMMVAVYYGSVNKTNNY